MSKSALGGLLALTLLVATNFSVSHALHQFLHPDGSGGGHVCLACSLAKGQVAAAAVALVFAMLTCCCFGSVRRVSILPLAGFDYRVSLSRAPPLA